MSDSAHGEAWVFHSGALGDFVMIWPLIRALGHMHPRVHVVTDSAKTALAARWIEALREIVPHDAQRREFTRLWTDASPNATDANASLIINGVVDPAIDAGSIWERCAHRMFPSARIMQLGAPGSPGRRATWTAFDVAQHGEVRGRENPDGPIVLHVGAGSAAKRWPLAHWLTLRNSLTDAGYRVELLAGEVEADRFDPSERREFDAHGGRWCESLETLATTLSQAKLFVGADTGPTHLAAQLGVATLALFGPTDPAIWSPRGPRVHVLHPIEPAGMTWLAPSQAAEEAIALLTLANSE